MIIAIDGPAASGKGTLGKRLAHHYGYRHLDTGVIYRVAAGVCGIAFKRADGKSDPGAAAVPGAPGAPAAPKPKPEGR